MAFVGVEMGSMNPSDEAMVAASAAWRPRDPPTRMTTGTTMFADATFDYVFSWGVLHHSRDTQAAFHQVSRVLKPNGQGMVMVYNRHSLRYFQCGIHALLLRGKIFKGETFKSAQRFYTDGYYHRHFSPRELTECLAKEGLSVDKITITYMKEQMLYKWPKAVDDYLKDKIGWLLVAEFTKKGGAAGEPAGKTQG